MEYALIRSDDGGRTGTVLAIVTDPGPRELEHIRESSADQEEFVADLAGFPIEVGDWVEVNEKGEVCAA